MTHSRGQLGRALRVAVLLLVVGLLAAGTSFGQSGSTNLSIEVQSILVLHYFKNVSILLDSNALAGVYPAKEVAEEDPAQKTGFDVTLGIDGQGGTETSAATLTLKDAWAVRSINANNTQVAIALDTATLALTTDSNATIAVSSPTVNVSNGATKASSIDFAAPGMKNPQKGDVNLVLDLTNATKAGSYEGAVFTITATNL